MAPKGGKKKQAGGQEKAAAKAKAKVAADKTFGMKNKNKSKKVQQTIAHMTAASRHEAKLADEERRARKAKKEAEARAKAEMAMLFNSAPTQVTQAKVAAGVDPKSVVCEFFKKGLCKKGARCKFSHDMATARKSEKIDIYSDTRQNDTMEDWDDEKLKEVVGKKHGKGIQTTTDIVCKYFLEAIETKKYGWFWECPNGGNDCKYRHALPPGYVLQSSKKKADEGPVYTIEEIIESERAKLGEGTPVTLETFMAWKKRKLEKKAEEAKKKEEKEAKEKAKKPDKAMSGMSGKALFTFNPDLFVDDESAAADYEREDDDTRNGGDKGTEEVTKAVGDLKVDAELFDAGELEGLDDLPDNLEG